MAPAPWVHIVPQMDAAGARGAQCHGKSRPTVVGAVFRKPTARAYVLDVETSQDPGACLEGSREILKHHTGAEFRVAHRGRCGMGGWGDQSLVAESEHLGM